MVKIATPTGFVTELTQCHLLSGDCVSAVRSYWSSRRLAPVDRVDKRRLMMADPDHYGYVLMRTARRPDDRGESWRSGRSGAAFLLGMVAVVEGPARSAFVSLSTDTVSPRNAISPTRRSFTSVGSLRAGDQRVLIVLVGSAGRSVNAVAAMVVVGDSRLYAGSGVIAVSPAARLEGSGSARVCAQCDRKVLDHHLSG
jgi:hypothetical protein